jgi:DNA-binding PucR family transcriptional regulator
MGSRRKEDWMAQAQLHPAAQPLVDLARIDPPDSAPVVDSPGEAAYRALYEIGNQIQAAEVDAAAIFTLIVDHARDLLTSDLCWLSLVDQREEHLRIAATSGASTPDFGRMEVKIGQGIGGVAVKEMRPVAVRDLLAHYRGLPEAVQRALHDEGVVSVLCAPMVREGSMVGALYVGNRTARDFSEDSRSLLSALASQAAVTIENSRLCHDLAAKNDALEQAFEIHRFLTDAALAGVGLDEIARRIARLIDHDLVVTIGEARGRRYSCLPEVTVPVEIEAGLLSDQLTEGDFPIVAGGTELGTIRVLTSTRLSPAQRKAVEQGAIVIALERIKEQAAQEVEWRLQGELLEELLRVEGDYSQSLLERANRSGVDPEGGFQVAVFQADQEDPLSLLHLVHRSLQRQAFSGCLAGRRGERVIAAIPATAAATCGQLVKKVLSQSKSTDIRAGISGSEQLRVALMEAEGALGLALSGATAQPVVDYADLGPLRFMLDAPNTREMAALVRDMLLPVAEYDAGRGGELLFTLRAFLESGGHHPTIATRCHIHVSTLKYRLARISEILGRSLADPRTRFELSLAFEVAGVLELIGMEPFEGVSSDRRRTT